MGFSYGTVIGAVYAQMFPDRVARMVLDSPVDLSADALTELRGNATGFEQALDGFLAQCASRRSCAFHSSGDPTSALRALQRRFEQGLALPADDPTTGKATDRTANVATFYTALISALYDKDFGWPELAGALNAARAGNGTQLLGLADLYNGRQDDGTYDNIDQVIGIILCDDRDDPVPTFDEYRAEYERDVADLPVARGLRRQHRRSDAIPAFPVRRRRNRSVTCASTAPRRSSSWARPATRPRRSPAPRTSSPAWPAHGCSRSTAPSTPRTRRTAASTAPSTDTSSAARCRPRAPSVGDSFSP